MNMSRRGLALGLAGLPLLAHVAPAQAQSSLTFLFVEAEDCEPCRKWHSTEGYWWRTSPEYGRVNTQFIRAHRVRTAYSDQYWPQNLRRYRDVRGTPRATPAYFVIKDDKLVLSAAGLSAWRREVFPALRQMVAALDGRRSV